jgi:hypothetical protein
MLNWGRGQRCRLRLHCHRPPGSTQALRAPCSLGTRCHAPRPGPSYLIYSTMCRAGSVPSSSRLSRLPVWKVFGIARTYDADMVRPARSCRCTTERSRLPPGRSDAECVRWSRTCSPLGSTPPRTRRTGHQRARPPLSLSSHYTECVRWSKLKAGLSPGAVCARRCRGSVRQSR